MSEFLQGSLFPVVLTLLAFRVGQLVQGKWKNPLFNPTLIATILVILFLLASKTDVGDYVSGNSRLSWLMTPATISLAVPMYEQLQVLRRDLKAIVLGVAAGAVSCLVFLVLGGLALKLTPSLLISLAPKSVTTAIGVPLSELYGGLGGVTTAAIIITGIFANMVGSGLCRVLGITDPVAQGVAFGTAGHVIGTARANELGPLTGAVSSLSLVTAGLLTAVLFPLLPSFLQ